MTRAWLRVRSVWRALRRPDAARCGDAGGDALPRRHGGRAVGARARPRCARGQASSPRGVRRPSEVPAGRPRRSGAGVDRSRVARHAPRRPHAAQASWPDVGRKLRDDGGDCGLGATFFELLTQTATRRSRFQTAIASSRCSTRRRRQEVRNAGCFAISSPGGKSCLAGRVGRVSYGSTESRLRTADWPSPCTSPKSRRRDSRSRARRRCSAGICFLRTSAPALQRLS